MFQLHDRRAVVTGAASGIGLAIARQFSAAGAEVLLCDLHDNSVQAKAAEIPNETGNPVQGFAFDVANATEVQNAFKRIGAVDLLVNCAGIAHVGTLASTSPEDLDRLFSVNVRGTYLCMRAALPSLLRQPGGCILNMASIAGTAGIPDRFAYSMTKGAVVAMTLSVARDYIAHGLRCNCISPARIHTPFVDGFVARNYPGQEQAQMAVLAAAQPIGRMGTPEEVASLALYLCSSEAGFITGTDYLLDGGFTHLR